MSLTSSSFDEFPSQESQVPQGMGPKEVVDASYEIEKLNLNELVHGLSGIERLIDMPDEAFDPAVIVGDIRLTPEMTPEVVAALKKKVDSIRYVVTEFDAYAARTKIRVDRLTTRMSSAKRRAKGLLNYIEHTMESAGFEMLPGNEFVIKRVRASNPSLFLERDATAEDMLEFGTDFVVEVPTSYVFQEKAIKTQLKAFYKILEKLPTCETCKGKGRVIKGEEMMTCGDCMETGKALPADLGIPEALCFARLEYSYSAKFDEADEPNVAPRGKRKEKK